jgi:hypothetical protein
VTPSRKKAHDRQQRRYKRAGKVHRPYAIKMKAEKKKRECESVVAGGRENKPLLFGKKNNNTSARCPSEGLSSPQRESSLARRVKARSFLVRVIAPLIIFS